VEEVGGVDDATERDDVLLIVMDLGTKPSVLLKKSESREEPRDSFMLMIMMIRA